MVQGLGRVTAALYFPGAQSVQTPAPAALYLPPGHCTCVGVVDPGGQANLWGCNGGGDIVVIVGLLPFSSLALIETVAYSSQWKRLSAHIFVSDNVRLGHGCTWIAHRQPSLLACA